MINYIHVLNVPIALAYIHNTGPKLLEIAALMSLVVGLSEGGHRPMGINSEQEQKCIKPMIHITAANVLQTHQPSTHALTLFRGNGNLGWCKLGTAS